jgi:hypothetical protein
MSSVGLRVENLTHATTKEALQKAFSAQGDVVSVKPNFR